MLTSQDALRAVIDFLTDHHVSYMLIGGLANAVWGEVRATHDADIKVSIDMPLAEFRGLVLNRFPERQTQIPPHLRSPYVLHNYIFNWIGQFAESIESPEILARYRQLRARYDP